MRAVSCSAGSSSQCFPSGGGQLQAAGAGARAVATARPPTRVAGGAAVHQAARIPGQLTGCRQEAEHRQQRQPAAHGASTLRTRAAALPQASGRNAQPLQALPSGNRGQRGRVAVGATADPAILDLRSLGELLITSLRFKRDWNVCGSRAELAVPATRTGNPGGRPSLAAAGPEALAGTLNDRGSGFAHPSPSPMRRQCCRSPPPPLPLTTCRRLHAGRPPAGPSACLPTCRPGVRLVQACQSTLLASGAL